MRVENLIIETTRRCNLRCDHCMRGDPQNLDLKLSLVARLFTQIDSIDTLTFTGGEPSLAPAKITGIIDLARQNSIPINRFYIVTNAEKVSRKFMDAVYYAYNYCEDDDEMNEIKCVAISSDKQHEWSSCEVRRRERNIERLLELPFAHERDAKRDYENNPSTIWTGRAKDYYGYTGREPKVSPVSMEKWDDEIQIQDIIYLNCLGNVLPECDLSFEDMDNEEIILCNVNRKNFSLLNSIKRFNKRCANGDIYNIKVA